MPAASHLPPSPRHRLVAPLALLLPLVLLSVLHAPLAVAQNVPAVPAVPAPSPVLRVVFTPWKFPPRTWQRQNDSRLNMNNPTLVFIGLPNPNGFRQFNFAFLTQRFRYRFALRAPGAYVMRIGAMEKAGCVAGRRLFGYKVNGVSSPKFSVAELVGCETPYYVDVAFRVGANLQVVLAYDRFPPQWTGSISNFEVFATANGSPPVTSVPPSAAPIVSAAPTVSAVPTVSAAPTVSARPSVSPVPTRSPPPQTVPKDVNIQLDIGPDYPIPRTWANTHNETVSLKLAKNVPAAVFSTLRLGAQFELSFDLPPGAYNVELGFVEVQRCNPGARVFNVLINNNTRLEAYEIMKAAKGCRKAVVEKFIDQTVDALNPQPLVIQFQAIARTASISFVRILPSRSQCVPVAADAKILADHLAHSVPGTYPPGGASSYVDRASAGFVRVRIDGGGSHTHFSYGQKSGKILSYRWTLPESGKVLAEKAVFNFRFPLGTTRLILRVEDDGCTVDEAETTVSVTGNMQPGPYCYYYQGLTELPGPGTLLDVPRPTFSAPSTGGARLSFPKFPFADTQFVVRCVLLVEFTEASEASVVSVETGDTGEVRVYEGDELIIDSITSLESGPLVTSVGLASFEIIYRRIDLAKPPVLVFKVDGGVPKVSHDQSTVMPIIRAITPPNGRIVGGASTKISGYGLYRPLNVHFGTQTVKALRTGATSREVFVLSPPATQAMSVDVTAESSIGIVSNTVSYTYSDECDDVRFDNAQIRTPGGEVVDLIQPTAIALWEDGKLYIGTRVGIVQVVGYNVETLKTTNFCYSEKLSDPRFRDSDGVLSNRSILGIVFDPTDRAGRPFVSLSTLFRDKHQNIDRANLLSWSNGAVDRLKPATAATLANDPKQCLEFEKSVVRNLPVADGDHSVNDLVFTQGGDLLIAVGGSTNLGLPYGGISGHWESYFSGSVVIARLSRGAAFDGDIPYTTPTNMRTARPIDGYTDVGLYATGVRNLFSLTMARNGKVYALDMGPNCAFGNASSSCGEYVEAEAALRRRKFAPFPGSAIVGPVGKCRYGDGRPDKILEIKEGQFYGHPNLQRAAMTGRSGECAWIDPETGISAPPLRANPPANYEHNLALVQSAVTGVREYGGNVFCGKMRNDLVLSQPNSRGVWRVRLNGKAEVDGNPFRFSTLSGIRVEESPQGDLLFPKYFDNPTAGIFVMRPQVGNVAGLFAANALPFRQSRGGGGILLIGGFGFNQGVQVSVGSNVCAILRVRPTEIRCRVPAFSDGTDRASVKVVLGEAVSELADAVLYMAA